MGYNRRSELTENRRDDNAAGFRQSALVTEIISGALAEYGIDDLINISGPSKTRPRTICMTIKDRHSGTVLTRRVNAYRKEHENDES